MIRVLLLSPYPGRLLPVFPHDEVICSPDPLEQPFDVDWIISFGYRHIIREPWLSRYGSRLLNLHISLLPWNRGADPNLWSWIDDTPKGVSLHVIDRGLDTGPLIAQEPVDLSGQHTLRTSHEALLRAAVGLLDAVWRRGDVTEHKRFEAGAGSYHRSRDKDVIFAGLPLGWDTPVNRLGTFARPSP